MLTKWCKIASFQLGRFAFFFFNHKSLLEPEGDLLSKNEPFVKLHACVFPTVVMILCGWIRSLFFHMAMFPTCIFKKIN